MSASPAPADELRFHDFGSHSAKSGRMNAGGESVAIDVEEVGENRALLGSTTPTSNTNASGGAASASASLMGRLASSALTGDGFSVISNSYFSMQYWQQFWRINTSTLLSRLKRALIGPFLKEPFFFHHQDDPDQHVEAYGPIWITTTLILVLAATSNVAGYLHFAQQNANLAFTHDLHGIAAASSDNASTATTPLAANINGNSNGGSIESSHSGAVLTWHSDFSRFSVGCSLYYSYLFIAPAILSFIVSRLSVPSYLSLFELTAIFGYSLTPSIIILLLCTFPSNLSRLILLLLNGVHISIFLVKNCYLFEYGQVKELRSVMIGLTFFILAMHLWIFSYFFYFPDKN